MTTGCRKKKKKNGGKLCNSKCHEGNVAAS